MTDERGGGASSTTEPAAGTSTATDVPLKDFIGMQISYERRSTVQLLASALALAVFSWFQIQRRLENLNHENERLLKQQEGTVSSDTYKANEEQRRTEATNLNEWRKEVDGDRGRVVYREEFEGKSRDRTRATIGLSFQAVLTVVAVVAVITGLLTYIAVNHP